MPTIPLSLTLASLLAPDTAVWPVSISGWIALVTSIAGVVGGFVAYGKWIQRMNGFGERLNTVEAELNRSKGAEMERIRQFDAVMHEQRAIVASIARAEKASEACREEIGQHALTIGSQVAQAMTKMNAMEVNVSQRLAAVETALRLNQINSRPSHDD